MCLCNNSGVLSPKDYTGIYVGKKGQGEGAKSIITCICNFAKTYGGPGLSPFAYNYIWIYQMQKSGGGPLNSEAYVIVVEIRGRVFWPLVKSFWSIEIPRFVRTCIPLAFRARCCTLIVIEDVSLGHFSHMSRRKTFVFVHISVCYRNKAALTIFSHKLMDWCSGVVVVDMLRDFLVCMREEVPLFM